MQPSRKQLEVKPNSEVETNIKAKVKYLDRIGFASADNSDKAYDRISYYFEKPKHETVHVTDLWTAKEQHNFLKRNGLLNAEKLRERRARLGSLGGVTVKSRIQHDRFLDTHTYDRLPKLTTQVAKLRNRPAKQRELETFNIYTQSHALLELPSHASPHHYQQKLSKQRSSLFSPQLSTGQLSKINGLIEACSKSIQSSVDIRKKIVPIKSQSRHSRHMLNPKGAGQIAGQVDKLLANEH